MTYRRILAPQSGYDSDQRVLESAAILADKFRAHLEVFFVRPNPTASVPAMMGGGDIAQQLRANMAKAHNEAWDEVEQRARARFDEFGKTQALQVVDELRGPGVASMRFSSETNAPEDAISRLARTCELTVFNLPANEDDSFQPQVLEKTLLSSGRPCLYIPQKTLQLEDAITVGIAWDGQTEATHAVSQALPIIQLADKVEIISIDDRAPDEAHINELADYFTCLGIPFEADIIRSDYQKIEVKILETADERNWDFLVMGGYSHHPWREVLLSGPTRYILRHAELPIVQAH